MPRTAATTPPRRSRASRRPASANSSNFSAGQGRRDPARRRHVQPGMIVEVRFTGEETRESSCSGHASWLLGRLRGHRGLLAPVAPGCGHQRQESGETRLTTDPTVEPSRSRSSAPTRTRPPTHRPLARLSGPGRVDFRGGYGVARRRGLVLADRERGEEHDDDTPRSATAGPDAARGSCPTRPGWVAEQLAAGGHEGADRVPLRDRLQPLGHGRRRHERVRQEDDGNSQISPAEAATCGLPTDSPIRHPPRDREREEQEQADRGEEARGSRRGCASRRRARTRS